MVCPKCGKTELELITYSTGHALVCSACQKHLGVLVDDDLKDLISRLDGIIKMGDRNLKLMKKVLQRQTHLVQLLVAAKLALQEKLDE